MPFYEYECHACQDRFVRQQRMSDPPLAECPVCHGSVRKVITAPGLAVRGGGVSTPDCAPGGG